MTARKTAKGPTKKKAPTRKKASGSKTTAAKPATKAAGKATRKKARPAASEPARKATPAKAAGESSGKAAPAKAAPAKAAKPAGKVAASDVNLGHVFALRPRVSTTFKQSDFLTARHLLQDESWDSVPEAARAVAEKALALTNEAKSKRGFKPGR